MVGTLSSITEVATSYDISLRTLRFYEQVGLITPLRRGTVRLYSPQDRIRIELILKGRRLGFSLSEIRKLIDIAPLGANTGSAEAKFVHLLSPKAIVGQLQALETKRADVSEAISELREKLAEAFTP